MTFEEARAYLREMKAIDESDGHLFNLGIYLDWSPGDEEAVLDGPFTADDLEAICVYMRSLKP